MKMKEMHLSNEESVENGNSNYNQVDVYKE